MTRQEAKRKLFELIESGFINFNEKGLIDSIYDDFENRNCENCKHYNPSNYDLKEDILDQWIECANLYVETRELIQLKDFCCNKWETK